MLGEVQAVLPSQYRVRKGRRMDKGRGDLCSPRRHKDLGSELLLLGQQGSPSSGMRSGGVGAQHSIPPWLCKLRVAVLGWTGHRKEQDTRTDTPKVWWWLLVLVCP